jgi:DNA-binding IscR family transcriptional regulator
MHVSAKADYAVRAAIELAAAEAGPVKVRVALRGVLERVTLADLVAGVLPAEVKELIADANAWVSRSAGGHTPPPPSRRPAGPADRR